MMCGHTTPEVEARWGDYGDMAQQLLSECGKPESWKKYNVCDGQFPTDEEFSRFNVSDKSIGCPVPRVSKT